MAVLAPGLAKAYYDKILEIHFNRGSQGYEQKVVEYKDLMDKMMDNIQGVDRKTGDELKGYDFVYGEARKAENPQGTVSPILWSGIQIIRSFRNEIVHSKTRIDYDDYRMCVKYLAKAIAFFSQTPILDEVADVYSAGNFPAPSAPPTPGDGSPGNPSDPGQNAPTPGSSPNPAEPVPEGLQYQKTFKGVMITGYTGNATTLVIPPVIEGKEVIGIGQRAFYENKILQHIDFPENLKTIDENAFYGCTALHNVSLPEKLESIGNYAFNYCILYLSRRTKIGDLSGVQLKYLD